MPYAHQPVLAPSAELRKAYRKRLGWNALERDYMEQFANWEIPVLMGGVSVGLNDLAGDVRQNAYGWHFSIP